MSTKIKDKTRARAHAHARAAKRDRTGAVRRRRTVVAVVGVVLAAGGITAGLLVTAGPSPYQKTVANLLWSPPKTKTVGGHVYHLLEASTTYPELLRAKKQTAAYVGSAWCAPVLAGLTPNDPSVVSTLPSGSPLARALVSEKLYKTTPTTHQGLADDLAGLPTPAAGTHRFCTWVGHYPRGLDTTGGSLNPTPGLPHPAYPAYYGLVTSETVPVDIEYGWTGKDGRGVHVWTAGDLLLERVGLNGSRRLTPFSWSSTGWWSSTRPVPGPQFLPPGYHWNYAGQPIGNGITAPAGAATSAG